MPYRVLAPIPLMLTGAVISLALTALAVYLAISTPWLGLQLAFDESHQLPKIDVVLDPTLETVLAEGERLTEISAGGTEQTVNLRGFRPHVEPPSFPRYREHNALLETEDKIAHLLSETSVTLRTDQDRTIEIPVKAERPISSLPLEFWLFNAFGLIAWNVGLAVWSVRPDETAAKLLSLSGAGFFIATFFNSVYKARELALPHDVFFAFSRANHFGLGVMLFALLALMAYFPQRVTRLSPAYYLVPTFLFYQVNEFWQWIEWPIHTFYLPIFVLYLAGIIIAAYQWRISIKQPLDRAALKWMLLSIFIIMGIGLASYFIPIALFGHKIFPQWAMVGTASLLYIGFAFGVARYRLFDVQRWWLRIWGWFLGGLSVLLFDLALVAFLNLQPMVALGIAVVAVGWIYFPLRQWFWKKLAPGMRHGDIQLAEQVEKIAQIMPGQRTDSFWIRLLEEAYLPAGIHISNQKIATTQLLNNGAEIAVPLLASEGSLRMNYPDHGRRLFSREDRQYLDSLLTISRRILTVHRAEIEAVQTERQRIVRDLHDDVGGHLMTLLRRAPNNDIELQARKAIKALRETMRVLDGNPLQDLLVALDDLKAETEEKLIGCGLTFKWQHETADDTLEITMRQAINISRILSEAISNALEHARPEHLRVQFEVDSESILLRVENDGVFSRNSSDQLSRGRGLNNMTARASELGGKLDFSIDQTRARLTAVLPIIPD